MDDKWLFGWRVQSALALPELVDWNGDNRPHDLSIILADTVPDQNGWLSYSPAVQVGPQRQILLTIPTVGRYLVEDGNRITVEPFVPADSADVRTFLLGTSLAALCFQRGLLPLHASSVQIDGKTVLLAGNSGLGKSSLAAALHQSGACLLSDDLCALDFQGREQPVIWPAFPRLKLWQDTADYLKISTDGQEQSRRELRKFHIRLPNNTFPPRPQPLALVVMLKRLLAPSPLRADRLSELDVMSQRPLIHRAMLGEKMGQTALMFHGLASLARTTPVVSLQRYDDLSSLPELTATVHRLVQEVTA